MKVRTLARAGFTLVEVVLVTAVVSLVARVAAPSVDAAMDGARASQALGDVAVVRQAAYDYLAQHHRWPAEAPPGEVPAGLETYLEGFDFQRDGYVLDWEVWNLPDGLPSDPGTTSLAAVSVHPGDADLANALLATVRARPRWFALQGIYTFFVGD